MKRRKILLFWSTHYIVTMYLLALQLTRTQAAVVPPPWGDPEKNPCASMPGGWQLLYWPPLKQCFKIFTMGYPCPETMELSPTVTASRTKSANGQNMPVAECRCPPGSALSIDSEKCYNLFERGPCERGEYFAPPRELSATRFMRVGNRMGICREPRQCPVGMVYWPQDNRCYTKYTKGPCAKGKLLIRNENGLGECKCENSDTLGEYFYSTEETCHEHYTKGPCSTQGHLFLPGGHCDCHRYLPHYHEDHNMCFELNSPGPCPPGHIFNIPENITSTSSEQIPRAQCQCKDGYIPWTNGHCYRLYTRGPCGPNEFLINATSCVKNFCDKGRLYFPDQKSCYRIGSQGPCELHQVVVFDFTARPSVDGIAYNGMCGCSGLITNLDQQCSQAKMDSATSPCEASPSMVELNGECYKLYSRGPCGPGQWLEPLKTYVGASQPLHSGNAKCVCRPGYTLSEDAAEESGVVHHCNAPNVGLARWFLDIFG